MSSAAQRLELLSGPIAIGRLGKTAAINRQRLIGAEHHAAGHLVRHSLRLGMRKNARHLARVLHLRLCLDGALIDCRRSHLRRNARVRQNPAAYLALRGEDERRVRKPERH